MWPSSWWFGFVNSKGLFGYYRGFGYNNPKGSGPVNPKGSGYWRIGLIPRSEFLRVYARKSLYACWCIQGAVGTWILLPCWRSIHSLFLYLNCSFAMFTFHIFCNLVSRSYVGSLGCTRDKWICVGID